MVVRISSEELNEALFDLDGNYISKEAKLIDEGVFFYVPKQLIDGCKDRELEQYIYEHL